MYIANPGTDVVCNVLNVLRTLLISLGSLGLAKSVNKKVFIPKERRIM